MKCSTYRESKFAHLVFVVRRCTTQRKHEHALMLIAVEMQQGMIVALVDGGAGRTCILMRLWKVPRLAKVNSNIVFQGSNFLFSGKILVGLIVVETYTSRKQKVPVSCGVKHATTLLVKRNILHTHTDNQ